MNQENRELLSEVIKKNLECALDSESGSDEEKGAFDRAMKAIERDTAISKNDDEYNNNSQSLEIEKAKIENDKAKIENEKTKIENEDRNRVDTLTVEESKLDIEKAKIKNDENFRKHSFKSDWIRWGIELAVVSFIVPRINNKFKERFAEKCMSWEVDNTFTSTPGNSIRDFFRFK